MSECWHYIRFGTTSDGTITGMHCRLTKPGRAVPVQKCQYFVHRDLWVLRPSTTIGQENLTQHIQQTLENCFRAHFGANMYVDEWLFWPDLANSTSRERLESGIVFSHCQLAEVSDAAHRVWVPRRFPSHQSGASGLLKWWVTKSTRKAQSVSPPPRASLFISLCHSLSRALFAINLDSLYHIFAFLH